MGSCSWQLTLSLWAEVREQILELSSCQGLSAGDIRSQKYAGVHSEPHFSLTPLQSWQGLSRKMSSHQPPHKCLKGSDVKITDCSFDG